MSEPSDAFRGATMQTIADSLGLSRSAVSLALGTGRVSEATRERVRAEAARLGYVPNSAAARLRRGERNLVGLVTPTITNPAVAETALGMQRVLQSRGLVLSLTNTHEDVSVQSRVLQELAREQPAGLVLTPTIGTTAADLASVGIGGIPTVLLARGVVGSGLATAATPVETSLLPALDHLVTRHRPRTIGYFGGYAEARPRQHRVHIFSRLAQERDLAVVEAWNASSSSDARDAYAIADAMLSAGSTPPDALIVHSDIESMGVLRALHVHGIGPAECAVIGIGGIQQAEVMTPALTTVETQPEVLGEIAAERLLAQIDGKRSTRRLPRSRLTVRESCGCGGANR